MSPHKSGPHLKKTLFKFCFSWVKFQEDVEEGGKRWSKPFVPALQVSHSLMTSHMFKHGRLTNHSSKQIAKNKSYVLPQKFVLEHMYSKKIIGST